MQLSICCRYPLFICSQYQIVEWKTRLFNMLCVGVVHVILDLQQMERAAEPFSSTTCGIRDRQGHRPPLPHRFSWDR